MIDKPLQERAAKIIHPLIPSDAEDRVRRSFRQWNQIVRQHIRGETGLKLADGEGSTAIPVRIVEGFPQLLAQLIDRYRDPVIWKLIIGQPKIGGIIEGLTFLLDDWSLFEQWQEQPDVSRDGEEALRRALDIAVALQKVAVAGQIRDEIRQINEDILGLYTYDDSGSQVELYWMPIAMVSAMLDVRIEDLTLVVLIHELAHGYTHIGRDIDGRKWEDADFFGSDLNVIEGLAQFYAEVITQRMASRTPGPKAAYEKLLELQSGPYHAHRDWMKPTDQRRGEAILFTLIAARSHGVVEHKWWKDTLNRTGSNLGQPRNPKTSFF